MDPATFSGRHQDAIINRDFETGKLNWIIGDPEGWPEDMQKYFFKPVGDEFDWQMIHACMVLPNGDIMCFDNGHYRSQSKRKIHSCKGQLLQRCYLPTALIPMT